MSLNDEDKNWIASAITSATVELEVRLTANLENLTAKLEVRLTAKLENLLTDRLRNLATHEDLERVETSLLTEFHKWASPMEQRMRSHREILRTLDLETQSLDERITKLEPPQPN